MYSVPALSVRTTLPPRLAPVVLNCPEALPCKSVVRVPSAVQCSIVGPQIFTVRFWAAAACVSETLAVFPVTFTVPLPDAVPVGAKMPPVMLDAASSGAEYDTPAPFRFGPLLRHGPGPPVSWT